MGRELVTIAELKTRKWVNPYAEKLLQYQGKIFPFEQPEAEAEMLRQKAGLYDEVICELGSGSGRHLISCAKQAQANLFVGFEIRFKRAVRTIEKAERLGVHNLCVLRTDAGKFAQILPAHSISKIYINYPDPWAKKKQLKHRLLGPELLDSCCQGLVPNGELLIKTDHSEYFSSFLALAEGDPRFTVLAKTNDLFASPFVNDTHTTEFEQLFLSQDLAINYLRLQFSAAFSSP